MQFNKNIIRIILAISTIVLISVVTTLEIIRICSPLTPKEIYNNSSPYTVEIIGYSGFCEFKGSGFLFNYNGNLVVITAKHVVSDYTDVPYTVTLKNGDILFISQILKSKTTDVAVLILDAKATGDGLKFAKLPASIGDKCYVVGYPSYYDTQFFTNGIVDGNYSDNIRGKLISVSSGFTYGDSGGPVLNDNGEIIGIVDAEVDDVEFFRYVVPSDAVHRETIKLLKTIPVIRIR